MDFSLQEYVRAQPRILVVQTLEEARFIRSFHRLVEEENKQAFVWNDFFGLLRSGQYLDEFSELASPTIRDDLKSLSNLFRRVYEHPGCLDIEGVDTDDPAFYVVLDADRHLDEETTRHLKQIAQSGLEHPSASRTVVLVSESGDVPTSLEPYTEYYDFSLPSGDTLREMLSNYEQQARRWEIESAIDAAEQKKGEPLTEPEKKKVEQNYEPSFTLPTDREGDTIPESFVAAASGLTQYQICEAIFTLYAAKSRVLERDLLDYRKQQVEKSDLLEFIEPEVTFDDIAGLDIQKNWLNEVGHAFTEKGRQWGLVPPKGLLQVGVPGCGKSLTAKAVSNEWDLPLIRFDTGRVFSSRVGDSERNMRQALQVIESCAPAILWLDELEKGLSGSESSGRTDAGTTSRVIGTFLTWFEEHSEDIFLIATSNDISGIPSELVSRFDEVFFVDLPAEASRKDCFRIHLEYYWEDSMGDLGAIDLDRLAQQSELFTGREIDQIVRESLRVGYHRDGELTTDVLSDTLTRKPPMISTMREDIEQLLEWVGYDEETGQGVRARMASEDSVLASRLRETTDE